MPLIVMCGNPCCGKTTVATKLKQFFENEKNMVVNLINEESLNVNKNEIYKDSLNEKNHRSQLRSEVEKNISDINTALIFGRIAEKSFVEFGYAQTHKARLEDIQGTIRGLKALKEKVELNK